MVTFYWFKKYQIEDVLNQWSEIKFLDGGHRPFKEWQQQYIDNILRRYTALGSGIPKIRTTDVWLDKYDIEDVVLKPRDMRDILHDLLQDKDARHNLDMGGLTGMVKWMHYLSCDGYTIAWERHEVYPSSYF